MNNYTSYCYENYESVLTDLVDMPETEFQPEWAKNVSSALGLNETAVAEIYGYPDYNTLQTNLKVRQFWKYAAANGVNGTPTFMINGAELIDTPQNVDDWLTLLNNTYKS